MTVPKVIYQTYSSYDKIPLINRLSIKLMLSKNPEYRYEFYDDERIHIFIQREFDENTYYHYKKICIGAAKADFFRYAILFKYGGVYVDIDSTISKKLDNLIEVEDSAILTREKLTNFFVQWALVYDKGHLFLSKTLEKVIHNIATNRYPHDVHKMTGPAVYSEAIRECLASNPTISYREFGIDYNGYFRFKIPMSSLLYRKQEHWTKSQLTRSVLKDENA
ncbi:MAG: glycosyltransferase family 32 protein [Microcoleus sp.]